MAFLWNATAQASGLSGTAIHQGFLSRIVHALVVRAVMRHKRRAAEAELYALDDHLLHDMGIARCQIPMIVHELISAEANGGA